MVFDPSTVKTSSSFDPSSVKSGGSSTSFDPSSVATKDSMGRSVAKMEGDDEDLADSAIAKLEKGNKPTSWNWKEIKDKPLSAALTPIVSAADFVASLPEFATTIAGYAGGMLGEGIRSTIKGEKYNAEDVAKYGKMVGEKAFGWLSTLPSKTAVKLGADPLVGSAGKPLENLTEAGVDKLSKTTGMSKAQASMVMDVGMILFGEAGHKIGKATDLSEKMTKPSTKDVGEARDKIDSESRRAKESRDVKESLKEKETVDQQTGEIKVPEKGGKHTQETIAKESGLSEETINKLVPDKESLDKFNKGYNDAIKAGVEPSEAVKSGLRTINEDHVVSSVYKEMQDRRSAWEKVNKQTEQKAPPKAALLDKDKAPIDEVLSKSDAEKKADADRYLKSLGQEGKAPGAGDLETQRRLYEEERKVKEEQSAAESVMDESQKQQVESVFNKVNNIQSRFKNAMDSLKDRVSKSDVEKYKAEKAKIDQKFQKDIVDLSAEQILNKGLRETKILDDYAKSKGLGKVDPYKNDQIYKDWSEEVKDWIGLSIRKRIADGLDSHFAYMKLKEIAPSESVREQVWKAIQEKTTDSLEGKAKELHDTYKQYMEEYGKKALDAKVVKGLVEDYATRILDFGDKTPEQKQAILDKLKTYSGQSVPSTSKFGKERSMVDFEDLTRFMEENNLKFKTTDLAEVFKEYSASMNKAIANNEIFNKLKETKLRNDPLFIEVGPDSYVPNNYKKITGAGIYENYAVHPDIYPALKHLIDAGDQNVWLKAANVLTSAVKRSNIGMSAFHASSLTVANALANSPKDLGNIGKEVLIKNAKDGLLRDKVTGRLKPEVRQWVEEGGLMFGISEDTGAGAIKTIAQSADKLVSKVLGVDFKYLEKAGTPAFKAQEALDHLTWTMLHDGLKYMTAEKYLEKARLNHPEIPDSVHRQEIGRAVNNIYGGLDWFDAARNSNKALENALMKLYSPEGRRGMQTLMFAPDWTLSTIRAFTEAIPKSLLKPAEWDLTKGLAGIAKPVTAGDYARLYQMRYALTALTLVNGVNMALSGHPIWQNKDPTSLDLGDGTTMAWAKHPSEPLHWTFDFEKTLVNKLGFLPSQLYHIGEGMVKKDSAIKITEDAIKRMLPFSISGILDPKKSVGSVIGGFAGFPIQGKETGGKTSKEVDSMVQSLLNELGEDKTTPTHEEIFKDLEDDEDDDE